ncbi:MAG: integrase arm-type DNA-binding domain-containing protein [Proteobacteria bacterium]|nr:integrase arm-type DNA-binding domain-containing protein [Pseudomonadota bacterium]
MPRKAQELSALQVKRLSKPGLHAIGGVAGLQLQIKNTGARSWILRAQIGSRRRDVGLGGYPDVTLAAAKERARDAREQIRQGVDPVEARKASRAALIAEQALQLTFAEAAVQCHATKIPEFRSKKHGADWINSINRYADPVIGQLPVAQVDLVHIVKVLEPIWTSKTETATRVRQRIESVMAWAKVSGYRNGDNPACWKGNLEHALPKPSKVRKKSHFPALPWQEMGSFMADLQLREGVAARALEFLILTAARSGEVRLATWDEIDFDLKLWTISGERMKVGKPHRVPLSEPSLRILEGLPRFQGSKYLFTSPRGGSLSDMSISSVCRRMKIDAVPHGFRSSFKDWCRSSTAYADEVSELALAHVNSDSTRSAYARDELIPKRARLMADWAKFCEAVPSRSDVIPIIGKANT